MSNEPDPYWATAAIPSSRDLAVIRPATLPKGKRFETMEDAASISQSLEKRLLHRKSYSVHAETLRDCRAGYYRCAQPYCPLCARLFRRWLFSQSSHLFRSAPAFVINLLFETRSRGKLESADPLRLRNLLRARMNRAGFKTGQAVGGIEVALKGTEWILHSHVVATGVDDASIGRLRSVITSADVLRPIVVQDLEDPLEQLSYILKFHSYHRPTSSGQPYPLKPWAAQELVEWQAGYKLESFLFLKGLRRRGARLHPI